MTPQLIDFSRGGIPSIATLDAEGIIGVGRYAVNDPSPEGRGTTIAERIYWQGGKKSVYFYWESTEGWMLDGRAAGIFAAQNAVANLVADGFPPDSVIYFACDFDATPEQQAAIDDCLRGAASVIGLNRVGIYAGFYVIQRCAQNGTATFFCQTLAWSGGQWFPGNHLEQYDTSGNFFDGVDCDMVRIKQANYGQIVVPTATTTPHPLPPKPPAVPLPPKPVRKATAPFDKPSLPDWWAAQKALKYPTDQTFGGGVWTAERRKSEVIRETNQLSSASGRGKFAGENLVPGNVVHIERTMKAADGRTWAILDDGGHGVDGARVLLADLRDTPEPPASTAPKKK